MYGDKEAAVYDALYNRIKDYATEAAQVAELVRQRNPAARTLLDVGCGTGNHLVHFADMFEAAGVEASPAMAARARRKLPTVEIHPGDMRTFALDQRFDAVVCLFSGIGYMLTTDALDTAIGTMAAHLEPDGVLVVEPWLGREQWTDGQVGVNLVQPDDEVVVRLVRSSSEGRVSRMEMHYLHGTPTAIHHVIEHHELALFTREEYEAAFRRAGLAVDFDERGLTGRGLYTGVPSPGSVSRRR
ncbi:MAG: class I SAM-dependent methyltransferase [Acidimicrobiales bacterium]